MEMKDNRGPYLVIVPLSTLSNWVNEFRRWCPSATVVVYKGTPAQRKGLYKSAVREGHFNVLLTTYEYIIKDKSSLRRLQWQYAIVDEGHRMKNAQSKFAVTLGTQYTTLHRVLLTGTPLQNSLPELWSLLNFLLPTVFNSVETFDQWFNKPFAQFGTTSAAGDGANGEGNNEEVVSTEERMLIIQRLHELLRPFMLRRIKADVLDQLPDKVEKVLKCELSSWQKELYKQISYSVLKDGTKQSKRGLNNVVMQLRKVCNHPYMFTPEGYSFDDDIIRTSGKVELLDRMLPRLKAAGHRILMFFQMTAAMTILEDYFRYRNFLTLRLDGSTTGEERERRMELFNAPDSPYFIFLLSTRAGGLGLNLVSADTVIIFDSDWNPMMDLQAQDRAHRIGQKKVVSVFRLITNSPIEEKILSRANEKLNMSELVVEAGKFNKSSVEEDTTEERQKMMEILLLDFDSNNSNTQTLATGNLPSSDEEDNNQENDENEEKETIDFNELLSRNDEDYEFYEKLDSGEIKDDEFFESPGLLTDPNDIPDWIKYPNGKKNDDKSGVNGGVDLEKRRAAANASSYTDGLTEKQFLRMMEKQAVAEEEEAKARKLEWHMKRDKKAQDAAMAALTSTGNQDPNVKSVENPLPDETLNRMVSITKCVIAIREEKTKRRRSDIFREKPSQQEYPDYYRVIKKPIAINDIMRKCKTKQYEEVKEFVNDWTLMFENAKTFNGEESWIYADAKVLNGELERLLEKNKHLLEGNNAEASTKSPPKKKTLKLKLSLKRKQDNSDNPEGPKRKRGRPSLKK
jgi:superfamily II DNA/RNA helicase